MTRRLITLTALASTLVVGVGCSSVREEPAPVYGSGAVGTVGASGTTASNADTQYGYVRNITQRETAKRSSGAGAILGAVVGGALGNQVGSGTGRVAATAAGAVGGAMIGNRIEESRSREAQVYYQVDVRLDNGDFRTFDYMDLNGLRVGDRVRVQDGQLQRW